MVPQLPRQAGPGLGSLGDLAPFLHVGGWPAFTHSVIHSTLLDTYLVPDLEPDCRCKKLQSQSLGNRQLQYCVPYNQGGSEGFWELQGGR